MHISDNEGKDILKGLNNKLIKGNYTIPIVKVHGKRLIFFNVLFLNTLKIIEKLQGQYKDCGVIFWNICMYIVNLMPYHCQIL